jgi:hypothetical protein
MAKQYTYLPHVEHLSATPEIGILLLTRKLARTAEKLLKSAAWDPLLTELIKALRVGSVAWIDNSA